jgi:hypothetical protein
MDVARLNFAHGTQAEHLGSSQRFDVSPSTCAGPLPFFKISLA